MKIAKYLLISGLLYASSASAALVSLNFTTISVDGASTFVHSAAGDTWRATNVSSIYGIDALFTITSSTGTSTANVEFVNEPARGNNMRVRIGESPAVTNVTVTINISFVNTGTSDAFTGWTVDDQLITQFSDLDSDPGFNRTDFGGAAKSSYTESRTSNNISAGSSLLEIDTATVSGYDIYTLQKPWTGQGNVSATDPASQSPVTAAFLFDTAPSTAKTLSIVVGQLSVGGAAANRHIDIDMTPDFTIIPEPSTALLGSIGILALLHRRR